MSILEYFSIFKICFYYYIITLSKNHSFLTYFDWFTYFAIILIIYVKIYFKGGDIIYNILLEIQIDIIT